MAGFGIASNTAWSFFMDRDNGIFYEMLTYPISRARVSGRERCCSTSAIGLVQAFITVLLAAAWCSACRCARRRFPLLAAAVVVGTAGWFFFYAIFALAIRRNDAFNTVTSIFYFVFLFASSMFYPIDPLPAAFRVAALANPITWHVDVMRFATIGLGDPRVDRPRSGRLRGCSRSLSFAGALYALRREGWRRSLTSPFTTKALAATLEAQSASIRTRVRLKCAIWNSIKTPTAIQRLIPTGNCLAPRPDPGLGGLSCLRTAIRDRLTEAELLRRTTDNLRLHRLSRGTRPAGVARAAAPRG